MSIKPSLRAEVLTSPFLPFLIFPYRFHLVTRHLLRHCRKSLTWLFRSREFTNFTYDLTPENKQYLAWFIADISKKSALEIQDYILALEGNEKLSMHISRQLRTNLRGNEIDETFFGRRVGWYAIVRACKLMLVVETGTDKGLGSLVLAEAISGNGFGCLITIDVEPSSGLLIGDAYEGIIEHIIDDSVSAITRLTDIDLFIHYSDHSTTHEMSEFEAAETRLSKTGLVISDNAHATTALAEWALKSKREFYFFAERPLNHWYSGAGIEVAMKANQS